MSNNVKIYWRPNYYDNELMTRAIEKDLLVEQEDLYVYQRVVKESMKYHIKIHSSLFLDEEINLIKELVDTEDSDNLRIAYEIIKSK